MYRLLGIILAAAPAIAAVPQADLVVINAGSQPITLRAADIATLPRASATATFHGVALSCEGAWLTDVLARAGAESGETLRGKALTRVVVATGADGYRVAFTLGELDHDLGNAPVVVADRCNGAALPATDGPLRLVAATDRRGARSVRQLVRLELTP